MFKCHVMLSVMFQIYWKSQILMRIWTVKFDWYEMVLSYLWGAEESKFQWLCKNLNSETLTSNVVT